MVGEKEALRDRFKRKLNDLDAVEKQRQSEKIFSQLHSYLKNQQGLWTLFSPLNDEPNILALLQNCPQIQWAFPRVLSKEEMSFFTVSCGDELITSGWGLEEPPSDAARVVKKEDVTGCLIPGLAFDRIGNRLGRGGGYYDRFLQNFKGHRLGVTFIQGLATETLPRKSHDQKMNIVISPNDWIEVETSEVSNGI